MTASDAARTATCRRMWVDLDYAEIPANGGKDVEGKLQFVPGMSGRDDGPHPRLVARDGREPDSLRKDAFREQCVGQLHGQGALADDDRGDRAFAQSGVESERREPGLE